MRKLTPYLLSGFFGGLIVLGGGYLINASSSKTVEEVASAQEFQTRPSAVSAVEEYRDFSLAAEDALPSVVLIKAKESARRANSRIEQYNPFSRFFDDFMTPYRREGSGSGVILTSDGYIVTNNHVVDFADEFKVTLHDGREFDGYLIGSDKESDLAVLKIEGADFPAVKRGSSASSKVGEWVLAIGNPFELTNTVTAGIISAKGRDIGLQRGGEGIEAFIQTDAAVNAGNSGGALVNLEGELIGINTAIFTRNGGYVGYSFAIPVEVVSSAVEDIIETGTKGYLGITIADMDSEIQDELELNVSSGVYVYSLQEGGSAQYAGVLPNDVIIKVNGDAVRNVDELQSVLENNKAGDKIDLTIDRYGKRKEIPVVLKAG